MRAIKRLYAIISWPGDHHPLMIVLMGPKRIIPILAFYVFFLFYGKCCEDGSCLMQTKSSAL